MAGARRDFTVDVQTVGIVGTQLSNGAVNATLDALYRTFIEPANAKQDPLQGPLNVTLDSLTAGIVPTYVSRSGGGPPRPSLAQLQYAMVATIVQGVRENLEGSPLSGQVDFNVTREIGAPPGELVATGYVKPVAGK